ncbi:hypothetical protein CMO93_04570 [Candidatus Woesearchaeota archaeon]|nr:hypothetical protein [Candidatus Woesearchaeota archaeon]
MPEAEQKFQDRQIAYKTRIKDVLNSKYIKVEGFNPNYLEINGQKISRVNIIGVIVQKSELDNQKNLIIDDGNGVITARTFENNLLLDKIGIGDVVLLIGRPREFSMEKYLLVETIKKIEPGWVKVRKLELGKDIEQEESNEKEVEIEEAEEEKNMGESQKNKILKLIKKIDKGEGVFVEDISSSNVDNLDEIIGALLREGDVFEIRPGKLKVLE